MATTNDKSEFRDFSQIVSKVAISHTKGLAHNYQRFVNRFGGMSESCMLLRLVFPSPGGVTFKFKGGKMTFTVMWAVPRPHSTVSTRTQVKTVRYMLCKQIYGPHGYEHNKVEDEIEFMRRNQTCAPRVVLTGHALSGACGAHN